jgi:two-component system chemotaxis response regulator CheY
VKNLSGGKMAVDKNMKILVVDDFATMRRIVKNILIQLGFKNITEADDGTTAIKVLQQEKVDLIISDWNMPKMTGLEFLKEVRAEPSWAKTPFIMVTAEAQQDNIILAVKARVSQYIVKPFTADTLSEKIQKIFG